MNRNARDWAFWVYLSAVLITLTIPVWMGIGKFQLCKYYFPKMNRIACFFTQLTAVVPRN